MNDLSARVDRNEVTRHARLVEDDETAGRAFIAAMVWGYGPVGYGPFRTARVLQENADAGDRLAAVARVARDSGGMAAFEHIANRPLRYLGVAFGTKYLYFCSVAHEHRAGPALILDAVVCRWLADDARKAAPVATSAEPIDKTWPSHDPFSR